MNYSGLFILGSPPPMRGKVRQCFCGTYGFGITPAYAGKRLPSGNFTDTIRDHPRLCGEKQRIEEKKQKVQGSPPPMRGKAA